MSGLANLETYDAFADAATEEDASSTTKKQAEYVHIRIQQRNGRKSITSVSGLNQNLNLKKILKEFKVVSFNFFTTLNLSHRASLEI
mmetsp:Transcript_5110/g.11185  ORF Transcript_5110/g.11185 Transcript_5110/m.11185 type:complete len:87 (+) Transcript_5110:213-473(+)